MKSGPMRILVVDDSADTARMMAVLLKAEGHKVKAVFDGPEALQAARELRPDVVFLDLMLPSMGGVEVAEELRRIDGFEETLIVALSGHDADQISSDFDGHFLKPVDPETLISFLSASSAATP